MSPYFQVNLVSPLSRITFHCVPVNVDLSDRSWIPNIKAILTSPAFHKKRETAIVFSSFKGSPSGKLDVTANISGT